MRSFTALGAPRVAVAEGDTAVKSEYVLKRVVDFGLASIGLLASLPLWVAIACAVKLEDGGPIFFSQQRWGRGRKPFRAYKFRSMVPNADQVFGAGQAGAADPRLTRVGRVLRPTSLDELPQLLNIWRGDMSWVGPRALPINEKQQREAQEFPDEAIPGFAERCRVRPGLTGIAQVYAPRDVPRRQKFRYDTLYLELMSLSLDMRLICLSVLVTAAGRWGRRGHKLPRWLTHGAPARARRNGIPSAR